MPRDRVRITSDGTPGGSRVLAPDDSPVGGAVRVDLDRYAATAQIELSLLYDLEVEAEPVFMVMHPRTRELVRIKGFVLPDGSIVGVMEAGYGAAGESAK